MKKIFSIFTVLVTFFFLAGLVKAEFSQTQYSEECKNAEQNDFAHFFCWTGMQFFSTTTPPSVIPSSGTFDRLTLKLHSRNIGPGFSRYDPGLFFWDKENAWYCYLSGFIIPNDDAWHNITFPIDSSTNQRGLYGDRVNCRLDFASERLRYISMNDYHVDAAWSEASVYPDRDNFTVMNGLGIPFDRSLYFIINQKSFAFTSPQNNGVVAQSPVLKVTGICPTNGSKQLAIIPHSAVSSLTQADYRVDCLNGQFTATIPVTVADGAIYAMDKTSGDIIFVFINVAPAPAKTPVLIVPGVLGTEMIRGNDVLWANPKMSILPDNFMDSLVFNNNLTPSDAAVLPTEVIKEIKRNIGGVDVSLYNYTGGLIDLFTSSNIGYTPGVDLFTFPYDWRYGVSGKFADGNTTVEQLKGQIDYILTQTDTGKAAGKVDIIAHSTGGLLVKKYVMENPGSHHINKAVFVGVPNLGAPKAFKTLINGDNFDVFGLNPNEMKKIGQNLPVVYDLAPSLEYYNQAGSFLRVHNPFMAVSDINKDLNYTESIQKLESGKLINQLATSNSQNLHTEAFDNYDLRSAGVSLYSIVGCKNGTFGKFTEIINRDSPPTFDFPRITTGDKTVPFVSADNLIVDGNKTFFAPKIAHGDLLSADGARQQIVNLISGSTLSTSGKILTRSEVKNRPDLCEIKGEQIKIKSPVAISVTDQSGNVSKVADDGSVQNDIPGADYEVWGEHKYIFLPTDEGQAYNIQLKGTGIGTFTLEDESIDGANTIRTQIFSNLPVTSNLIGSLNFGAIDVLALDTNSDGTIDQTVQPSAVLDANQSQDLISPVSTSTITGTMGQPEFYRSDVTVALSATDLIIPGKENQTSGVLKTVYSLDGSTTATYQNPITVSQEGQHTISFFSTDRAGNNEPEQSISFVIDKTPPELIFQLNLITKDLDFVATDTLPTVINSTSTPVYRLKSHLPKVIDNDNIIIVADSAGNQTVLAFSDKDRKRQMRVDIKSLTYNEVSQDISKTQMHFEWQYDKNNNLKSLDQQVKSKKDFNIEVEYKKGKTELFGKDQTGKIKKIVNGLVLLKVFTNKGDLGWGY